MITLNTENIKSILARKIAERVYQRLQPITHTSYDDRAGARREPAEWDVDLERTERRTLDTSASIEYDGDTTITITLSYTERDI